MSPPRYAAIDLGASSGRVITAVITETSIEATEVHRFANTPLRADGRLHWDVHHLYRQACDALESCGPLRSIGIDSWAVDYGLLDGDGELLGLPHHYRDTRTSGLPPLPNPDDLYAVTGIADLPFNTLNQLRAEPSARLAQAEHLLLIPDLMAFWLTGSIGAERTNASTTQLFDARARGWSAEIIGTAGLPAHIFPALREAGDTVGPTRFGAPMIAVASHDTACAVAAVPASGPGFAYISCGTWSLAGLELSAPILTPASRAAGFTNEAGIDGSIRYLRNVMGLWLLQECQRHWDTPIDGLLAQAHKAAALSALVDASDPIFLSPGDMPSRIAAHAIGTSPETPGEFTRCILDSLALAHREAIRTASVLSGQEVDVVHLVGGGARNRLLCQLTADACGLPVIAGPAEATALGNLLIQARVHGVTGDLAGMRTLVRATQSLRRFEPRPDMGEWDAAAARVAERRRS